MTTPTLDLGSLVLEELPEGVPNHRASSGPLSSGESGEPRKRSGIFGRTGGASANRANNERPKRERAAPPKLTPGMRGQLENLYLGIGAMIRPFDELMGDTIIEQAPKCARSVYDLAQSNDAVRRAIIALTTTSATGAVVMAHLPIILVAARHSKNERVKTGAMTTMMGLKMADLMESVQAETDAKDEAE